MKAASIEEDNGRSQDLDHRAIMNGGFENHHLGPKTRETELRLGLSGSGLETLENEKKEDRWFLGQSCFRQNQWNGGVGYGVRAKRVFSDAMIGAQEAREVYGNGWNLGFMGAGEAGRNMVNNNIRKPTGFSLNETVKDGISDEKQKVPFEKNRKAEAHSAPDTRASPVVGWPPVRTFRKNLTPQAQTKPELLTTDAKSQSPIKPNEPSSSSLEDTMFVKVNMEGIPIGRKIDLKAYDSYDSLSLALQQMFKRFIAVPSNGKNETNTAAIADHVLIYEDNEGDRMLVGDVPWEMFVSTVKRLRIIQSSEAPPALGITRTLERQQGPPVEGR